MITVNYPRLSKKESVGSERSVQEQEPVKHPPFILTPLRRRRKFETVSTISGEKITLFSGSIKTEIKSFLIHPGGHMISPSRLPANFEAVLIVAGKASRPVPGGHVHIESFTSSVFVVLGLNQIML